MINKFESFPEEETRDIAEEKRQRLLEVFHKKADELDLGGLYEINKEKFQELQDKNTPFYIERKSKKSDYSSRKERPRPAKPDDINNIEDFKIFIKDQQRDKALFGEQIKADGMEYGGNFQGRIPTNTENPEVIKERLENIGKYCKNNGILAYIDQNGEMFVAPYDKYRIERLAKMNYKSGEFFVPFSNQEQPMDPELQKKWEELHKARHQRKR